MELPLHSFFSKNVFYNGTSYTSSPYGPALRKKRNFLYNSYLVTSSPSTLNMCLYRNGNYINLLMNKFEVRNCFWHQIAGHDICFSSKSQKDLVFQTLDNKGSISQTVHEFMIEILWNLFHSNSDSGNPISSHLCAYHDMSAVVACVKL